MLDIRTLQEHALFCAIKAVSDEETAKVIIAGEGEKDDAAWVNGAMARLEQRFSPEETKIIRQNCQCGYGMEEKLSFLLSLKTGATDLAEFAASAEAKAAGLSYENGDLWLSFFFCPCPMLAKTDRLKNHTWCQCTTGYSKVLFEKAFGCKVEVKLEQSIKAGDRICRMKIVPFGDPLASKD